MFEASSEKEMFDKERELVEIGPHSYNLKEGGYGGSSFMSHETRKKVSDCLKGKRPANYKPQTQFGDDIDKTEKAIKNAWSDEAREKRNKTRQERQFQVGKRNSQYGTMWITDGVSNRKIKKDEVIPEGWRKGRIIKRKQQ